jgi:hypothetical protein
MDVELFGKSMMKYFLEGLAVALAAYYIPKGQMSAMEVVMIAATAGVTFLVLDLFAPGMGSGARMGAGLGIGFKQVGFERFNGNRRRRQ